MHPRRKEQCEAREGKKRKKKILKRKKTIYLTFLMIQQFIGNMNPEIKNVKECYGLKAILICAARTGSHRN